MKTLGERIRQRREELDLSLREFAKQLECSAPFISDVELGRRFPSDEMFANIAKVLKIGLNELREHDQRAPLEEIRRITELDPKYAYAFRTLVEKQVSPEEIIKLASGKRTRRKDGPK